MPNWELATALAIALIVAMTTRIFYRRPPALLWPWLPLAFGSALIFSIGDLIAKLVTENLPINRFGMLLVYTGLFAISVAWWGFTDRFARMCGYARLPAGFGLRTLIGIEALLWLAMVTNPLHGEFIQINPGLRSSYGPVWWVMACVNYTVLLAAFCIHVRGSIQSADPTIRSHCRFLAAAIALPLALNMIYVLSPKPLDYDPTSLGFALSCMLFLYAVERRDLFVLERVSLTGLLDTDADAVIIVSTDFRVLFANPVAERLFEKGRLQQGVALDALLADVAPSFSLSEALHAPRGETRSEHRFQDGAGDELWVTADVSTVQRSRGMIAGLCVRLRDRTPLRHAREVVEEHASVLEAVIHSSGEGLLVQSAGGEIRYVNEAFARLCGVPLPTVQAWGVEIPLRVWGLFRKRPSRELMSAWHRGADDFDNVLEHTEDLLLCDGTIVEAQTFPIEASRGIEGRVWRLADVTRRRRDAEAMIHSQKLEGLGVLAGGIAHDFNNLLVGILANAELARKEIPEQAPAHAFLADVESAAVRASELTGQLLAYAGKASFDREELDLSSLVREVAELLMVSIPKGVDVDFSLCGDLSPVRAGSAAIRQIVMNLVTNAADAIGEEPGRIRIETGEGAPRPMQLAECAAEHGEKPETAAFLRVVDSGTGMDRRTLERIFDPFFSTKFKGRGLGLAATLGILDSHGGALRIETTLGIGSAFTVMLPIQEDGSDSVPGCTAGEDRSCFEGCRVLVVDDEPSVRSVLSKALGAEGLEVSQASTGEGALALLEQDRPVPDLVILDLTMPGLGGLETLERIRVRYPELPVLLSSGYAEEALCVLREKDSPWNGFIQKPYRKARLLEEIERLMKCAAVPGVDRP